MTSNNPDHRPLTIVEPHAFFRQLAGNDVDLTEIYAYDSAGEEHFLDGQDCTSSKHCELLGSKTKRHISRFQGLADASTEASFA